MKLTDAERRILARLDGSFAPALLNGHQTKPLATLAAKGFVTYTTEKEYVQSGPYVNLRTRYRAVLTEAGSDFIYEGGIDQ